MKYVAGERGRERSPIALWTIYVSLSCILQKAMAYNDSNLLVYDLRALQWGGFMI